MIRKISAIVLVLAYSLPAIGLPLHYHYCKGNLMKVTLIAPGACDDHEKPEVSPFACCLNNNEAHCLMGQAAEDCCDNDSEWVQLDEQAVVAQTDLSVADAPVAITDGFCTRVMSGSADVMGQFDRGPPFEALPIYLSNCSLVFYG